MYYIVIDLEFNQDFSSSQDKLSITSTDENNLKPDNLPFEIIQIGAIKLDSNFNTISTFNRYIKPTVYPKISSFISDLTGITTEQLTEEETFPSVFNAFKEFIGDINSIFCIWGMSDMKELFRNASYHKFNIDLIPKMFINIQPYASIYLGLPPTKLLRLQYTIEALAIPLTGEFHNALYDAYYTAEIFKKIYNESMIPITYTPNYVKPKSRPPKRIIDIETLFQQFEKMYNRAMTEEEKEIILLAYKMGKTHQFLKEVSKE